MKILTPELIREADKYTIIHEPVTSLQLMERAAVRAFDKILDHFQLLDSVGRSSAERNSFYIFCGSGNNGGDGLVIARYLFKAGFKVFIYIVRQDPAEGSADFLANLQRLEEENIKFNELNSINYFPEITIDSFVIDAIFGLGMNRSLEGIYLQTVMRINSFPNKVISIDIPSGLMAEDNSMNNSSGIVKAYLTLTFQFPKLSFLLYENQNYIGKWEVIDIGLSNEFIDQSDCKRIFLTHEFIAHQLQKRNRFSHKGMFGHALLVAGSKGKGGAAVLAARSILRAGAGLLTVHIPSRLEGTLQASFPEAMVSIDREADIVSSLPELSAFNAIGAGPGIGTGKDTANMLKKMIQDVDFPIVLDADALNIIADNKTWLSFLPAGSVLTPHPGEFDRLFGKSDNGYERVMKQKDASFKYGIYIVLKGAHTSVSCPDGTLYFNSTGNPGMSTAGTGDVLTGLITGLICRGYKPETATVLGIFIHGSAGDLAVLNSSQEALIASDLIDQFGAVFNELEIIRG